MPRRVVGVDLGGTNVRAATFDEHGEPLGERVEIPSLADRGLNATVDAICRAVRSALNGQSAHAVGIAIPGHIDDASGLVRWAPNFGEYRNGVFESWRDVPVKAEVAKQLQTQVATGNDANLAALGEYRFGTGNEVASFVLLTVGTGIGGGVVLRPAALSGKAEGTLLLLGGNQGGAELGHMVVQHGGLDCNAGSYGALEGYCQRDSIVRRAVHRLGRGRPSCLTTLCGGDLSQVTPKMIGEAADQGDALALEVWEEVGTYLGVGIANCINIFAPQIVAIGGQIARVGEHLLTPARRAAMNAAIPSLYADVKIVEASRIDDAGILGAAALAMEHL